MRNNYKRLGNYIQEVNIRNKELLDYPLLGVSIQKNVMPSIANIIGTDMSTYKLIQKNQFAYGPVTSRNGDKISIALLENYENALVSQAYTVFEVIDENELHPEYLMMWFRRPEFDRYARYMSHGSAREIFSWAELCDTLLPIPSPEKQQEIVREYNTIQNRIALNNQLIAKLEETAQAIYKQWFVDFEFPDENGKPYKSNGGEMVWCEELEKEIPEGFNIRPINSICDITSSRRIFEEEYTKNGIPFYRGKEISLKKNGGLISDPIFISENRYNELIKLSGQPLQGDVLMTAVGTIGSTYMVQNEKFYFKDGNVIWFKNFKFNFINYFLYDFMQGELFKDIINEITIGSTQSAITIKTFGEQIILVPKDAVLKDYYFKSKIINESIRVKKTINENLNLLNELLLAKMTKVESKKTLEKILEK